MTTQTLKLISVLVSEGMDKDWYGLELSKRAGLGPGTIYPQLKRLLVAGWLERRWEEIDPVEEGRPRRRLYRLTGAGESAARAALDEHLALLQRADAPSVGTPRPGLGLA
ncbi:MAG TPA: helix-turn-helix transcriptional regulator [Solirubrobacterales bacterium]|nr:helix-turn-helix transcriptional regulator [Solirubrobacterales bacterium]